MWRQVSHVGARKTPTLAVFKFASCDGCQLSLLDLEDAFLDLVGAVEIAYFLEATSRESKGPFDIAVADGSITTPDDVERLRDVRRVSRFFIALGACATSGGIQALRNFADVKDYQALVYPKPEYLETLGTSTAFADHVPVDYELRGCPVNKYQLLEVISAFLAGRRPTVSSHAVCVDCKLRGNVCVMVRGTPCLGPVTHAGCGALCPTYQRGCYGCFGPMETPNTASLARAFRAAGQSDRDILRAFRSFNANAPAFRKESEAHEG
jgi:sulfhydrogenase subunit delta